VLYQSISFSVHDVTNIGKCFSYQDLLLDKYIRIVQMPAYLVMYEITVIAVMSSDIFLYGYVGCLLFLIFLDFFDLPAFSI